MRALVFVYQSRDLIHSVSTVSPANGLKNRSLATHCHVMKTKGRPIGIRFIASQAGVSTATVTRTLSEPEKVAPKTRARILEVVEQYGYAVNSAAQSLSSKRAKAILLLGSRFDIGFADFLRGACPPLISAGLNVMVADVPSLSTSGRTAMTPFAERRVDFMLIYDWQGEVDSAIPHRYCAPSCGANAELGSQEALKILSVI